MPVGVLGNDGGSVGFRVSLRFFIVHMVHVAANQGQVIYMQYTVPSTELQGFSLSPEPATDNYRASAGVQERFQPLERLLRVAWGHHGRLARPRLIYPFVPWPPYS